MQGHVKEECKSWIRNKAKAILASKRRNITHSILATIPPIRAIPRNPIHLRSQLSTINLVSRAKRMEKSNAGVASSRCSLRSQRDRLQRAGLLFVQLNSDV